MRRLALVALLAFPSSVSAGETPTFCTSALMGACFYMDALTVEEVGSSVAGRSDYLHTLTGTWAGSALNGLTDLYWLARFDAYETSAQGRSVYIFAMEPGEPTQAWHDEYGQPQGLRPNLWDYLSVVIYQGWGTSEQRIVDRCGGGCYRGPYDLPTIPDMPTEPPTNSPPDVPVSVPEPATALLLLLPGLLALAHRRRSRTRLA